MAASGAAAAPAASGATASPRCIKCYRHALRITRPEGDDGPQGGARRLSALERCFSFALPSHHVVQSSALEAARRAGMCTSTAMAVVKEGGAILVRSSNDGGSSAMLPLSASLDPLHLPLSRGMPPSLRFTARQPVQLHGGSPHLALDAGERNVAVAVERGFSVFAVSAAGELWHRSTSSLPELETVGVACLSMVALELAIEPLWRAR